MDWHECSILLWNTRSSVNNFRSWARKYPVAELYSSYDSFWIRRDFRLLLYWVFHRQDWNKEVLFNQCNTMRNYACSYPGLRSLEHFWLVGLSNVFRMGIPR